MNEEVMEKPERNEEAALVASDAALHSTSNHALAPPFDQNNGWKPVPCRDPRGFWTYCSLHDSGHGILQVGTKDHPPNSPLTIGWAWTGWDKPGVRTVHWNTPICAVVRTGPVSVRPNGGHCVPRAFLTLRPAGGGAPIESSVVLSSNRTYLICAVARRPGIYTVGVSFNVRSVYQGSATPYCEIIGQFLSVSGAVSHYQAVGELEAETGAKLASGGFELSSLEEREFSDEELLEQIQAFGDRAGGTVLAGPDAFVTAEST